MNSISFSDLPLSEPLQKAIRDIGYETPTPIQRKAIPPLLEGNDLLGIAQTGTGKTAAFSLPILERFQRNRVGLTQKRARALILTPTRELAAQIADSFADYGRNIRFKQTVIFGGVGQNPQVQAMRRGVDVLVATPGRLLDLIDQGHILLDNLEVFVLDEADRMLDMGFIHDVRKVIKLLPTQRQTLLFSATMPPEVAKLAEGLMRNPVRAEATPPATTVERIEQSVRFVSKPDKRRLLALMLKESGVERSLVFTRTKHGANRLVKDLLSEGIQASAIHGNKSQSARTEALNRFRDGRLATLVATDIAARGIDVEGVSHVFNFDLPNEPESYVHRIGRTARAGAEGVAVSFCEAEHRGWLRDIERLIGFSIKVDDDHPYHSESIAASKGGSAASPKPRRRSSSGGGRRGGARRGGSRGRSGFSGRTAAPSGA